MQEARVKPDAETVLVLSRADTTLPAGGTARPVESQSYGCAARAWDDERFAYDRVPIATVTVWRKSPRALRLG